jgi:hypothetical protein
MSDDDKILDIKLADLKSTAPHFHHQSVALGHALTRLKTGLADAGAAWGDDKQGTEFHKKYGPLVKKIEHSASILKDGLESIHAAMKDMADGHIDNEHLVRAMFSRIQVEHDSKSHGK